MYMYTGGAARCSFSPGLRERASPEGGGDTRHARDVSLSLFLSLSLSLERAREGEAITFAKLIFYELKRTVVTAADSLLYSRSRARIVRGTNEKGRLERTRVRGRGRDAVARCRNFCRGHFLLLLDFIR